MPIGENAEDRARNAINAKDPKQGQEMQQVQALQSSIQEIQGERRNNLMAARVGAEGDARENQAMLQAAEMGMLGGAGAVAVENATPVQQTSPQTQAILSKYGVGKPKNQTTTTRNVQQTPTKITINNNTTNNTTNNVAVPPSNVGGPVQGRTLAIRQQPDQGQARFKTWINNAFARQNQAAAQREKEYQRREWSLSRTTGKLMKKLQELGTTISERMDPRKIASSATNHFKTLLFLFGTMFLAKNWKKIIHIGASIERFFWGEVISRDENGKVISRGEPGWKGFVRDLFGAKEGESIGDAIQHFFWNDDNNGVFDLFMDKIKNFFKERADAAKAIKFPDIDLKDIPGTLKGIAGYLGDILKALIGGADAVKENIGNSINRASLQREKDFGYQSNIGYKVENSTGFGSNTSYGDKVLTEAKEGKTAVHLLPGSVDSSGNLTDKASASISQSNSLAFSSYNNAKHGYYDVAKVSAGLSRLNKSVENKGKVPVSEEFLKEYLTADQINSLKSNKNISYGKFKYWKREKTKEELAREGAGDFLETAGTSYIVDEITGGNKFGVKVGKAVVTGDADYLFGNEAMALKRGTVAKVNKWLADKYTYELVPVDAKVPGEKNEDGKVVVYKYPVIDKIVLDTIRKNIGGEGDTFDLGDKDYTTSVQKYLESKYDGGPKISILDPETGKPVESPYDMNVEETYKELDKIKREAEKRDDELKEKYNDSPLKRSVDYVTEGVSNVVSGVKNYVFGENKKPDYKPLSTAQQKENAKKVVDFFTSKGFTTEQAAGVAGVWHYESEGINPSSYNKKAYAENPNGNYDRGIAQWQGSRVPKFKEWIKAKYGDNRDITDLSLEDQLEYAWKEMNERPAFIKALKEAPNVEYAVDAVLRGFENGSNNALATPAQIDAVPGYRKYGNTYKKMMEARVPRALGIYNQLLNIDENQQTPQEDAPTTQPDASGVYLAQNNTEEPENYVELPKDDGSSTDYRVNWNEVAGTQSWGGNSYALAMANEAAKTPVTPDSSKPVQTGGKTSIPSSGKTAETIVTSSNASGNTDKLLADISGKLNNLSTLTAAASDQQVQATMGVAQAIGNIQIIINTNQGSKIMRSSQTGSPYNES